MFEIYARQNPNVYIMDAASLSPPPPPSGKILLIPLFKNPFIDDF